MKHFSIIDKYTTDATLGKVPLVIRYKNSRFPTKLVKNLKANTICEFCYSTFNTGKYLEFSVLNAKNNRKGTFVYANKMFFLEYEEPEIYL